MHFSCKNLAINDAPSFGRTIEFSDSNANDDEFTSLEKIWAMERVTIGLQLTDKEYARLENTLTWRKSMCLSGSVQLQLIRLLQQASNL
jgi:hypothetical protein